MLGLVLFSNFVCIYVGFIYVNVCVPCEHSLSYFCDRVCLHYFPIAMKRHCDQGNLKKNESILLGPCLQSQKVSP